MILRLIKLKLLRLFFDLNSLITGEDSSYISQQNIDALVEFALKFNEEAALNIGPIFTSKASVSYILHKTTKMKFRLRQKRSWWRWEDLSSRIEEKRTILIFLSCWISLATMTREGRTWWRNSRLSFWRKNRSRRRKEGHYYSYKSWRSFSTLINSSYCFRCRSLFLCAVKSRKYSWTFKKWCRQSDWNSVWSWPWE